MADGDKDKPQITQSSNSNEPPPPSAPISPLDKRSVSPLAPGAGPLGPHEPPKRSIPVSAPVSRSVPTGDPPKPVIPISQEANRPPEKPVVFGGGIDPATLAKLANHASPDRSILDRAAASIFQSTQRRDESLRGDLTRAVEEHERKRAGTVVSEPSRVEPSSGQPMHPRDRRLYVFLGIWVAIFVAVISGGIAAFIGGFPHWGVGLCAGGLLGAYMMTLHLLERRPAIPTARSAWAVLIGVAIVTWIFSGLQIWFAFHKPIQGYSQAQLDTAISTAKVPIQAKLDEALADAKNAKAQLAQKATAAPQLASSATQNLGRTSWSNLFNEFTQPGQLQQLSGWWVIITAPPENSEAEKELNTLFMLASNLSKTLRLAGLPDYSQDLDAPKLEGKALRGITVHGRNQAADFIAATLSNCFLVLRTAEIPAGLFDYYHRQSSTVFPEDKFVWLEIGNGSPWKGNCRG